MESLNGILGGHIEEPSLPDKTTLKKDLSDDNSTIPINNSDSVANENSLNLSHDKDMKNTINHIHSDQESGFDELSSQMSKSGLDDLASSEVSKVDPEEGICTMESSMTASVSRDQLSMDQLHLEIDSVAVDWKSFRQLYHCACASPFDSFTKKASSSLYLFIL